MFKINKEIIPKSRKCHFSDKIELHFTNVIFRFASRTFSHIFISSANLSKERWNVGLPTFSPHKTSLAALAAWTFYQSALTAASTDSPHASLLNGLPPRHSLIYKIKTPSIRYHSAQWLTHTEVISFIEPAVEEQSFLVFRGAAVQLMQKQ